MSATGLETLDHSVQLAHEWINELDSELGWGNRHRAWRLLRAVLQAMRDCLPLGESAHLSAQLPMIIRGAYFEHWRPTGEHAPHRDIERFFAAVDAQFPQDPLEETDDAISAVFGVLENHISGGEIRHVIGCLPGELRELWPAA